MPIACDDYDYVEIACLLRLPVKLRLINGEHIEGVAQDTQRDQDRQECVVLDTTEATQLVRLTDLVSMQALRNNPHFDLVKFQVDPLA